jgi:ribonuclease J
VVLHTGDFNFDPDPPDGEPTDVERLAAIGDAGVALLLSDSTNIDVPERPGSEREVAAALRRIVTAAENRVFVVMFASNVQRLRSLCAIAVETGRKLCLMGRSLSTHTEIASAIGKLDYPSNLLVDPDQARTLPRGKLLVLAGGSQAERTSAMRRLASGEHGQMQIDADDDVVFSSRIIPGHERVVFAMLCDLLRLGARLHTRVTDPAVHTSGHAGRSEQRRMIELIRPRAFVPVHGTLHHLLRHAELARELGVQAVDVIENGSTVVWDAERGLARGRGVVHGKVDVALGGERISAEALKRRAEAGRTGYALVSVVMDRNEQLAGPPAVSTRGVPIADDDEAVGRAVARGVAEQLRAGRKRRRSGLSLEEEVRRAARRVLLQHCGVRPQIEVHVHRLSDV